MPAKIAFFPVDNGDMTLIEFYDERTLLIDISIRALGNDPDSDIPDVASELRNRLKKDSNGRPYVDAFLLSHPDQDHCRGFKKNFHVGPIADYVDDNKPYSKKRIVIRELWSSPIVFKRASQDNHVLCEDAKALAAEARRRVKVNREKNFAVRDGDRILVIGEDADGKTDDLGPILVKVDETIRKICGATTKTFSALVVGPLPYSDDAKEEEELGKNDSSVILNIQIAADDLNPDGCKFLTCGDAEVGIWEREWKRHKATPRNLEYDVLQTPHHCSWHSVSWDSWSEKGEDVQVSKDAKAALSRARPGAVIVASSKPIKDDDVDPPCIRAKREYEGIAASAKGKFICTGEYATEKAPKTLIITVTKDGAQEPTKTETAAKARSAVGAASTPLPHG